MLLRDYHLPVLFNVTTHLYIPVQAARQLQALTGGAGTDLGPSNPLYLLERALGVAQVNPGLQLLLPSYALNAHNPCMTDVAPRRDIWDFKTGCW